jgi:hypothetical protein
MSPCSRACASMDLPVAPSPRHSAVGIATGTGRPIHAAPFSDVPSPAALMPANCQEGRSDFGRLMVAQIVSRTVNLDRHRLHASFSS